MAVARNPWVLVAPNNATGPQLTVSLVCLPPAGGSGAAFAAWQAALPPSVAVLPVELPGRGTRVKEPPHTSMDALVGAMLPALLPELQRRPFVFFGHSMGAWVAYALTQELARRGGPVPLKLYASANRSPLLAGPSNDVDPTVMHTLKPTAFWAAMERRYGRVPELENATIRKLLLPGLKADFQVIETWTAPSPGPSAVLPCCVAALGARQDNRYTPPQLAAWEAVAPHAGFENWWFDGGHSYVSASGTGREQLLAWLGPDVLGLAGVAPGVKSGAGGGQRYALANDVAEAAATGPALGLVGGRHGAAPQQLPTPTRGAEKAPLWTESSSAPGAPTGAAVGAGVGAGAGAGGGGGKVDYTEGACCSCCDGFCSCHCTPQLDFNSCNFN